MKAIENDLVVILQKGFLIIILVAKLSYRFAVIVRKSDLCILKVDSRSPKIVLESDGDGFKSGHPVRGDRDYFRGIGIDREINQGRCDQKGTDADNIWPLCGSRSR